MHRILLALSLLICALVPASAQDQWREFRSDADGFSVSLPQTPEISARRIGTSTSTQTSFLIDKGEVTYLVSVIQFEKGKGPQNPDQAYFQNLLKNYVEGGKVTLRSSKAATIAGKPGIEGVAEAGIPRTKFRSWRLATASTWWCMSGRRGRKTAPGRRVIAAHSS